MEEIVFPNQIRMFRRVRGKPMKSLASILNLSLSAVSKIEKGYRRIDEDQLEKISQFLNCPKDAIFVSEKSSQPEVVKAWKREEERRKKINSGSGLKTLGAGLRYIRGGKGLTLQDVTKGAKLTLSVYHRIEMGQREVDEKVFKDIAHALGFSPEELQLKIYELDMSGALDELKKNEGKSGIFTSKGGYNDLPVSRFMMRSADAREIVVPIYGLPAENGRILVDKEQSVGSVLCPSTFSEHTDLYAVRLTSNSLGNIIPKRAVLIVAPHMIPQAGDIAVWPEENDRILVGHITTDKNAAVFFETQEPTSKKPVSKTDLKKMHRLLAIIMP